MLWIAFPLCSLQSFIQTLGAFYIVNFVAAGGILGTHYLFQNSSEVFNGIAYTMSGGMRFEVKIFFLFSMIMLFVVLVVFKNVQASRDRVQRLTTCLEEVEVYVDDICIACTGLVDTGNQLSDPLSGMPVIVMEFSLWHTYFPVSWQTHFQKEQPVENLIIKMEQSSSLWQSRMRLVPYRGINRSSCFMLCIRPDKVIVAANGQRYEHHKVLVGLDGGKLSIEGKYEAIIHPELISL